MKRGLGLPMGVKHRSPAKRRRDSARLGTFIAKYGHHPTLSPFDRQHLRAKSINPIAKFYWTLDDPRLDTATFRRLVWPRGNECEECGNITSLEIHHVKSLSCGGKNLSENLKVLCTSCHAKVDLFRRRFLGGQSNIVQVVA